MKIICSYFEHLSSRDGKSIVNCPTTIVLYRTKFGLNHSGSQVRKYIISTFPHEYRPQSITMPRLCSSFGRNKKKITLTIFSKFWKISTKVGGTLAIFSKLWKIISTAVLALTRSHVLMTIKEPTIACFLLLLETFAKSVYSFKVKPAKCYSAREYY